ncbi:MAG TPA: GYF domain-containing protein [Verrucomicrobiae bacterium]|nr:GYF domain-containing protein [Verrucomicrobiae bacterium]
MDLTYKVRGADGSEYGPATLEQLNSWMREGRVHAQSEILRSDQNTWATAVSFPELSISTQAVPAPIAPVSAGANDAATLAQLKSGASWFYWIAALSLVNSIVAFTGSDWRFIIGLGITQLFDAIGHEIASGGKIVALVLDLITAGVFILFGVFANKGHLWAFIVGMVLFALDGLIFLLAQDWIGVAFHVFVLYCLFRGVQACRQLKAV